MLMAIDVGNTNITVGYLAGEQLKASFRLTTKIDRTSDEFGMTLYEMLDSRGVDPSAVDAAIISSVVPKLNHALTSAVIKYFHCQPLMIGPGTKTGLSISIEDPKSVGADRIVDLVAGYHLTRRDCLVVDFGTATTFDYVDQRQAFLYGITAPGLGITAQALSGAAAKLPEVEIAMPKSILATNTIESMQAGIVYGYIGLTEHIIATITKEIGHDFPVIATGGLGRMISGQTALIDTYEPNLAFIGMRLIYERNASRD